MTAATDPPSNLYDVFVSHTSSDKSYVRELVDALRKMQLSVWFDEEQVGPSVSFVRQINHGLRARSAVAVISQEYLDRDWPRKELDVLIQRHVTEGMPLTVVAHGVEHKAIGSCIALLTDHSKLSSSKGLGTIADHVDAALGDRRHLAHGMAVKPRETQNQHISVGHLPTTGGNLLGRDAELGALDRYWSSGTNLVTVFARGGEGKTELIRHWVLSRLENAALADARWIFAWSFYAQGQQAARALDFLGAALLFFGDTEQSQTSPQKQVARLVEYLRRERGLLILDGFETIQAPPGTDEAPGSVRDPAIAYLVKEMVAANPGLCLVTTRVPIHEIRSSDKLASTLDLSSLTIEAGVALLRDLGVRGNHKELAAVVERVDGHALSITLSGSYIVEAHGGEVSSPLNLILLEEDSERGGHAWRVLESYQRWLEPAKELTRGEAGPGKRADLLQLLRMTSVFDLAGCNRPTPRAACDGASAGAHRSTLWPDRPKPS